LPKAKPNDRPLKCWCGKAQFSGVNAALFLQAHQKEKHPNSPNNL
jgi:hypothetical protein